MNKSPDRRAFLGATAAMLAAAILPSSTNGQQNSNDNSRPNRPGRGRRERNDYSLPVELARFAGLSLILGRISDRAVVVSVVSKDPAEAYVEFGNTSGTYTHQSKTNQLAANEPAEITLDNLRADTEYFYRVQLRKAGQKDFEPQNENRFHTQRSAGKSFTFAIQGDSHPERPQSSDPNLYARTLQLAAADKPDFYICMGDDFSIDHLRTFTPETIASRYTLQRPFLGLVAHSAPLFLINGNHEQASLFNYNQTGIPHDAAVWAQNARNKLFPMPVSDHFYSADKEDFKSIGPLRDYYSWTWGDALFVVLDNYWHSPALVDNALAEQAPTDPQAGNRNRDWWGITIGDAQYQWFKRTLEQSKSKFKFVFAHHVLGGGRGGIEMAEMFEWGGRNRRGQWEFDQKRPGWELPIHQLMVKHKVNIFFQGHDHLFAKQERDGIIYQEVPMPSDPRYVADNEDRYLSGVKHGNSGYLRVTVKAESVDVQYIRTYLKNDETDKRKTGEVAHSYKVLPYPSV